MIVRRLKSLGRFALVAAAVFLLVVFFGLLVSFVITVPSSARGSSSGGFWLRALLTVAAGVGCGGLLLLYNRLFPINPRSTRRKGVRS